MKTFIPLLFITMLIISCNSKNHNADYVKSEEGVVVPASLKKEAGDASIPIENQSIEKKIIKDGRMGLQVRDLEQTKSRINDLIKLHGAYFSNERFSNNDWESSYSLVVRIPSKNFDQFILDIESGGDEILYKNIDTRDVTDQFIDLETRLNNKRNYLKRYNDLLKKANSIKEILDIEEKVRVLEEEIESTTGRLKYLSDLVDYSTLNLTISKKKAFKYKPGNRDKFSERIKQSISKGWFGFVDFLLFAIKFWPFLIIAVLVILIWKKTR